MARYVAFLRAVNVAGHARVDMNSVRDLFMRAGCERAETYIQSGNVIFDTTRDPLVQFPEIRARICKLTGEQSAVVFRSEREIQALVRSSPFKAFESDRALKLYAVCLLEKPRTRPTFPCEQPQELLEAIGMKGLDVLVVSRRKPNGFYGFPNSFVEKALGVPATSRNWSTVTRVAALMNAGVNRQPRPARADEARRGGSAGSRSRES